MKNPVWERDELILALYVYLTTYRDKLPSGREEPETVRVSQILQELPIHSRDHRADRFRTPRSVGAKLSNFRYIDPDRPGGLSRHGANDKAVWDEFICRPAALLAEVERISGHLTAGSANWVAEQRRNSRELSEARPEWDADGGDRAIAPVAAMPAELSEATLLEVQRIIDRAAARRASARFVADGWRVEEVSDRAAYALHCSRSGREIRRIAAAGVLNRTAGAVIQAATVDLARREGDVALFLLIEPALVIHAPGIAEVRGGRERLDDPWRPDPALAPSGFRVGVF